MYDGVVDEAGTAGGTTAYGTTAYGTIDWREVASNSVGLGTFAPRPADPEGSGLIVFGLKELARREIAKLVVNGVKYDRVVVTRPDQYHLCPVDLDHFVTKGDLSRVWIPVGEDYMGGVCDRWVLASGDDIDGVLGTLGTLGGLAAGRYGRYEKKWRMNCEMLFKANLVVRSIWNRVVRFERPVFTAAVPGDPTRWSKASGEPVEDGVRTKYPDEYMKSVKTCIGVS